ncbi:MAG: sel1 repeat family protein [Colwellia sp.]|nr:sel1 repeat family protein [Colwellia sp.]MCW8865854.1 sel1 repeat family protein [Colwellia sp.]MCW9082108.1 sel1 repeat family protein [Colwellia sp.]
MTNKAFSFFTLMYILICLPIQAAESSKPEFTVLTKELCLTEECKRSFRKLKNFARKGSTEAQVVIAIAYLTGNGLEKNPEKAVRNLKKAKRSGSARAAWTLSYLYTKGIGVSKDTEQANELLQYALDKNFGPALFQKASEILDLSKKENEEAIFLLKKSISTSNKNATYLLAQMYEFGEGVEQNIEQALKLYSQLKFSNYKDSQQRYEKLFSDYKGDPKLISLSQGLDPSIETITVSGAKWDLQKTLTTLVHYLDSSGLYDGGGFSHIRGKGCANSSSACAMIGAKEDIDRFMGVFR